MTNEHGLQFEKPGFLCTSEEDLEKKRQYEAFSRQAKPDLIEQIDMSKNVTPFFMGDKRYQTVFDSIAEVLYERGKDLPLPGMIGVLELLKYELLQNAKLEAK
jgi:hypothetical protein